MLFVIDRGRAWISVQFIASSIHILPRRRCIRVHGIGQSRAREVSRPAALSEKQKKTLTDFARMLSHQARRQRCLHARYWACLFSGRMASVAKNSAMAMPSDASAAVVA
jgi:hypothetical protein